MDERDKTAIIFTAAESRVSMQVDIHAAGHMFVGGQPGSES